MVTLTINFTIATDRLENKREEKKKRDNSNSKQ